MYKIGDFSSLAKVTVKTLRFYEEMGLLTPAYVDEYSGYRYYDTAQLYSVAHIVALRQAGVSIEGIKKINSGVDILSVLQDSLSDAQSELSLAQRKVLLTNSLIKNIKENTEMKYQAVVKTLPEYTIYYKRGVIKDFSEIVGFILGSGEECLRLNPKIKCLEPDYCFVAYLDGEYKEKDISIEYAQAVTKAGVESDNIKFRVLPSTKAVCVYHKGPFETIGGAYAFAMEFVKANGYEIIDYCRERYIDGMWNCESSEDWLTEIEIPIK